MLIHRYSRSKPTVAADSGPNDTVTVGTDTLTFAGTSNEIETTVQITDSIVYR